MKNKLYLTLSNLFNEIKTATRKSASLDDEIDNRIKEAPEVTSAREGFPSLNDRLSNIQNNVVKNSLYANGVDDKLNSLRDELINKIPKNNTGVIEDVNKDILVSLDNKVSHKEDLISLTPNSTVTLPNDGLYTVSKAYMSSTSFETALKTISFNSDTDVDYDKAFCNLKNGTIYANGFSELYELPLNSAITMNNDTYDCCIIGNLCTAATDYFSPIVNADKSINYTNHLINALNGNAWNIARGYVTVMFSFTENIPICEAIFDFTTNSSYANFQIDTSEDGSTWNNIYNVNITTGQQKLDFKPPSNTPIKSIRFIINAYDGVSNRNISISNIKLFSLKYNQPSKIVASRNQFILDLDNTKLMINTESISDSNKLIVQKYALVNIIGDGSKPLYTYIPKTYNLLSQDFYDSKGYRCVQDSLQSYGAVNKLSNTYLYSRLYEKSPINAPNGQLGNITMTKNGSSYSNYNAWLPYTNIAYKISITLNGENYEIPLSLNNINNILSVTLGGSELNIQIRVIDSRAIKVFVTPVNGEIIKVDAVNVVMYSLYSLGRNSYYTGVFSNVYLSLNRSSIKGYPINLFNLYNVFSLAYINWYWSMFASAFESNWASSPYNSTENGAVCAVIPQDIYSGTETTSSYNADPVSTSTYSKIGCNLPVNIYIGCDGIGTLQPIMEADCYSVQANNLKPIYSFDEEYTSKTYIGKDSKIVSILPNQTAASIDDIQYSISFDGYNYYYINSNLNWLLYTNKGMTSDALSKLNDSNFESIRAGSEWLYIKVKLITPNAYVQNITLNFDNDYFEVIADDEILSKGMTKRCIENINPTSLTNKFLTISPILFIYYEAYSLYPAFQFQLSGYTLNNYLDIRWQEIDNVSVVEYLLGDNGLLYKNNSTTETKYIKVIRNIIQNQTAVIDARDETKDNINTIKLSQEVLSDSVDTLKQSVTLMHDTFLQKGTVPSELPSEVLPALQVIEVPTLKPNEYYVIENVPSFRGVQLWDEITSYIPYSDVINYNNKTTQEFTYSGISFDETEACLSTDYDRDNAYICPENVLNNAGALGPVSYPMFDVTASVAPTSGDINEMLENGGTFSFSYSYGWWWGNKYIRAGGYTVYWDLPGEATRWVDVIFDFKKNVWINYLTNLEFGLYDANHGVPSTVQYNESIQSLSYQITTFSFSKDGKEYTDIAKYSGTETGTINFNTELRYIRIRMEVPYSYNRGCGTVTFTGMNIYFSPVHYIHNTESYIYNSVPIDSSKWLDFTSIKVDRFIDHDPCEMRFLLSEDANQLQWKYWDGTTWQIVNHVSLAQSMSIETLLALTNNELNQLKKGSLSIASIMKTTDIWKTPILRSVEFIHSNETKQYYSLSNPYTVDIKYSDLDKTVTVTNTTNSVRKIKIVLL
ncbi:hypothetical protein [Clostridium felsineum]|uniref:Uncharacterized protein n=1 Tax=Clostridium felsineum TaxID=36839 RepID=A0A1S8L1S2_9CLOT|nr:hypothetical protein [Clostridium felsineum]URZ09251.1 hypothetical protein CLROS_046670 [Clostridium felsineum]URZ13937.1 hypothetical protein CROST_047150 [Clostridium felsineum]